MTLYRNANKAELEKIAELLADSFKEDPFSNFLAGKYRDKALFFCMQYSEVRTYFEAHKCLVGVDEGKIVSVVLLKEKGKKEPGFFNFILNGGLQIISKSSVRHAMKMLKILDEAKKMCRLNKNNEWYLNEIAVDKEHQGNNKGSEIIQKCIIPYISKCGGGTLFLITNTDKNRRFYKKNGFQEFDERIIKGNCSSVPNWSFKMKIKAAN